MTNKKNKKILVAEDEKPLSKAIVLKLEKEGYDVVVANDGLLVKEELVNNKFDLILMDLMMPYHDGFTLLEEMKKNKNKVPIIVLSSLGQDEDIRRAKDAGAKEYFIKSNVKLSDVI